MVPDQRPIMVLPFVPGTSDKLQKLALQFRFGTWYSYPGHLSDLFTQYHGRVHLSKAQNSVYCLSCSCGVQYVGESSRNLKVRIAEHLRHSSNSSLTAHLHNNDNHKPVFKNTQILAREGNTVKRKIMESLCINHKKAHLCNSGFSVELPQIWQLCVSVVSRQLAKSD